MLSNDAYAGDTVTLAQKRGTLVAKTALYGLGGGLIVGVATQVVKRSTRTIFLCGSLGLYAGIIMGVYVLSSSRSPHPYEGPDTYNDGDYSQNLSPEKTETLAQAKDSGWNDRNAVRMNLFSLSF